MRTPALEPIVADRTILGADHDYSRSRPPPASRDHRGGHGEYTLPSRVPRHHLGHRYSVHIARVAEHGVGHREAFGRRNANARGQWTRSTSLQPHRTGWTPGNPAPRARAVP